MVLQLLIKTQHNELYKNHKAAYIGDSGIDLFFPNDVIIKPGETVLIDLEIQCEMREISNTFKAGDQSFFISKSYYLYPRSSIYKTGLMMANSVGIIDSQYRNSIKVPIINTLSRDFQHIKRGDRLFQICSPDLKEIKLVLTDTLSSTSRGDGFGSSGVSKLTN
jgi:dUTP pyrophosphatase